jgi:hypothetical protein
MVVIHVEQPVMPTPQRVPVTVTLPIEQAHAQRDKERGQGQAGLTPAR